MLGRPSDKRKKGNGYGKKRTKRSKSKLMGVEYDLGEWAEGEGADLTNPRQWDVLIGPRLGEDISSGQEYNYTTGQKINDLAIPPKPTPPAMATSRFR